MDQNIKAVIEVGDDVNGVIKIISGTEAYRKYNWILDLPKRNVSGNFRGMVINARWRMVHDVSSNVGELLGNIAVLVSLAEEAKRSGGAMERIFLTQDPWEIKASKISLQVSGICTRVILDWATGIVTTGTWVVRHTEKWNAIYQLFPEQFNMVLDSIDDSVKTVTSEWSTFTLGDKPYQLISTLIR
jgi:hypothetical protein